MKNKIISFVLIVLIIIISNITSVLARFADITDEETDKKAQEQIKEQETHIVTEVKSSDNYLTSLNIEGYTLTPEFDKQILEYTIKEEVKGEELNIKAITSNEKAKVNGAGIIKIEENKNEYRIDVVAENDSVRTYMIKLKETTNDKSNKTENVNEPVETSTAKIENKETEKQEKNETNSSNITMYIIIGSAIAIILLLCFLCKKSKRKGKH